MAGTLFDQFSVMISAATHDLGAAIVPTYLIESELAQGILIIIGNPPQTDEMYYFVTPGGVHNPVSGCFKDWVREEAAQSVAARKSGQSSE